MTEEERGLLMGKIKGKEARLEKTSEKFCGERE